MLCCLVLCIIIGGCSNQQPVSVILDTDLSSDVDDVGAVALLHSLAQDGDAKILAMMISSGDPWSGLCLKAINGFYGKATIPAVIPPNKSPFKCLKSNKFFIENLI